MSNKNTLEKKARFFAQYWGQRVFKNETENVSCQVGVIPFSSLSENDYLELKPLSSISDEQARHIADIFDLEQVAIDEMQHEGLVQWIEALFDETAGYYIDGYRGDQLLEMVDYLRSQSFLLPFDSITVDELQTWGWAKISEQ